jgi:hypothetical protein
MSVTELRSPAGTNTPRRASDGRAWKVRATIGNSLARRGAHVDRGGPTRSPSRRAIFTGLADQMLFETVWHFGVKLRAVPRNAWFEERKNPK